MYFCNCSYYSYLRHIKFTCFRNYINTLYNSYNPISSPNFALVTHDNVQLQEFPETGKSLIYQYLMYIYKHVHA